MSTYNKPVSVRLSEEEKDKLKEIGGSIAKGIQIALEFYSKSHDLSESFKRLELAEKKFEKMIENQILTDKKEIQKFKNNLQKKRSLLEESEKTKLSEFISDIKVV